MARVLRPVAHKAHAGHDRVNSTSSTKKEIWSTLLSSVGTSKRTPEKHLFVLGGTQETQRDFIEALTTSTPAPIARRRNNDRSKQTTAPVANAFALGYTYRDIYSDDGEDILARLSIHTLTSPDTAFTPLLKQSLGTVPLDQSALAILLDWERPWTFVSSLRAWIRSWRACVGPGACPANDRLWRTWRNGTEEDVPAIPGEYEEPLGVPTVVVCVNTQAVERLEKEKVYKESDFDFVMQFLRTIGLRHGAGLLYTMPGQPGQLAALVHKLLQIGEGLQAKDDTLKHNVVDRDEVFVPPGWDSWGKIRVLREGFDIEGISQAWADDIDVLHDQQADSETNQQVQSTTEAMFAERIADPRPSDDSPATIEVEHTPDQVFLAKQLERLEALQAEDDEAKKHRPQQTHEPTSGTLAANEQIGPVQFNMGGIQYDAADALRRIKERNKSSLATSTPTHGTPERARATRESTPFTPGSPPTLDNGKDMENLEAYFASLMKGGRSAANSPRVDRSPRVTRPEETSPSSKESGQGAM